MTLACDGRFYSLHKFVLSTCSDYFEEMFERTQCKHPVIVLKDIKSEDLEALLNYMYIGEVNVVQENLAGLIKAAESLRIKGLAVPDEEPVHNKEKTNAVRSEQIDRTLDDDSSPRAKKRRRENSSDVSEDNLNYGKNRSATRNRDQINNHPKSVSDSQLPSDNKQINESDTLTVNSSRKLGASNKRRDASSKHNDAGLEQVSLVSCDIYNLLFCIF